MSNIAYIRAQITDKGGCVVSHRVKVAAKGISFSHKQEQHGEKDLNIRHCHDTCELLYVTEGEGRYVIEGAEFPLRPRTLVLIRPFEYHFVQIRAESRYERYVIHFSPEALFSDVGARLSDFLSDSNGSGCFYTPDLVPQSAISVFDRFETAVALPEEDKELYLKLLLSELLLFLSLSSSQRIVHGEEHLGARVLRYLNDYLDTDITLDRLAKRFFVSKYYLCRTFKKYSGTSVHSYINHKRVMYAKQLMESGETASGAAYRVGFGDYSAFYRAFVKVIGTPPTVAVRAEAESDTDREEANVEKQAKRE